MSAQNVEISDDINMGSATSYGIIGKFNDRILFFHLDDDDVKVRAFDAKMRKMWEREIQPDNRKTSKILDIVGNRTDFSMIYNFRKKNRNYLKVHRYDGQVKLLDSATIVDWGKNLLTPTLELKFSEDKKCALIYEFFDNRKIRALAFSLDSLRPIWEQTVDVPDWDSYDRFNQIVFTNRAEAFFIQEEDNRVGNEKHRFRVQRIDAEGNAKLTSLPFTDFMTMDTKFSFDNVNRKLVGAGVYATKNSGKSQGYFSFSISPQYKGGDRVNVFSQIFEDEFVSAILGKKTTDNKGLSDVKVQEIVHRRDGGILVIFEQVKLVERRVVTNSGLGRYVGRADALALAMDYYHDNFFAISMGAEGITHWKSIFYKKQSSQDDGGKYSSYGLVKTPSTLRFLFNDEIEKATTVSEYSLNSAGDNERHSVMNTAGHGLYLRFHDGVQTGANEFVVPSEDRRHVKLVKIQF
ncbi:MAG: hypothetical protein U5L45_02830 [Saprospiraceae bacterium]|nr:hypothetical protein [Saprospiraceae bacterium]